MSLPVYEFKCSKCDFECPEDIPSSRFTIRIYNYDNKIIPLLKQDAWCNNCNSIVNAEIIPSLTDIDKVAAKFRQSIEGVRDLDERYNIALNAYKKAFVQNIDYWKKWAFEQDGRSPRCLNCGYTVRPLDTAECTESLKAYIHPGCGGGISRQESDLRISWKIPDEPNVVRFNAAGINLDTISPSNVDSETMDVSKKSTIQSSELHKNPFWLLGATSRDNRKRIVELADIMSLELDHELCQKARSDLINPRTRLRVELGWVPGVSPKKATQLIQQLSEDPLSLREEDGLPPLSHSNLMAAAFEAVGSNHSPNDLSSYIEELACVVEEISIDDVIRDINEDRSISGFPEVTAYDVVESELSEIKRYYKNSIKSALNRLPPSALVETMTLVVESATCGGEYHAPNLIDDLVDNYELESQDFLQKESDNIKKLLSIINESALDGEHYVVPLVDKLEKVTRNWDKVAQPIQLSAKARGTEHNLSNQVAYAIRSLGIDLFNNHNMLSQSRRITILLQELFAEIPEVIEKVEQDADTLDDIYQRRKQTETKNREWEREITYSAEIGVVFKDTLSISPRGVSWKERNYPLDSITRARWGGVSHSVNGIPTGSTYTIAFGDKYSEAVVETKREDIYSKFTDKLWRGVCGRILSDTLESVVAGKVVSFDRATLKDAGIVLIKRVFIGSDENVFCPWDDIKIYSDAGEFCITSKSDSKTYVNLSYIKIPNTHILEQIIRMAFKQPGLQKLSELLN